jgi:hypothetical protein
MGRRSATPITAFARAVGRRLVAPIVSSMGQVAASVASLCLSLVDAVGAVAQAMTPNPSVKGTPTSGLRPLAVAPYVER